MSLLHLPVAARRLLPGIALVLALAVSAHAQGTDAQREACTPDALKLCADTIPDIPKTTACMKAHEAALSPRCRAVFNEPATKEPAVATASKTIEARRETHAKREAAERSAPETAAPRRRTWQAPREAYADPLGAARDDAGDRERPVAPDGPAEAYGPDIRHFAPGDGPDEVDASAGRPPYGYDRYDDGPRYFEPGDGPRAWGAPGGWGGPRFADRDGPDGYDEPGPWRGGRRDLDGRPGLGRDDGPGGDHGRRRGGRGARTVSARMCARGKIDPHTCAVTERALRHERRD